MQKPAKTMAPAALDSDPAVLERIAAALERLAPAAPPAESLERGEAYVWHADESRLEPVARINRVDLSLLQGIERQRDVLLDNTRRFAKGLPANNALLWGARGMGKSSLVKAVHAEVSGHLAQRLILIEISREDIESLPRLMRIIAAEDARFIVFCDDLSFDKDETSYKSLKAILDGGLEGRPDNALFYATSNRRHMMPRDMIDNERATAINPGEAIEEKVSLSDRFGLWLGFHNCDQPTFLSMIRGYCDAYGLEIDDDRLTARAIEWAQTRGARSGRVAIQFVRALAGEMGKAV
jgi:predicted AAA+ superfamily ATPase